MNTTKEIVIDEEFHSLCPPLSSDEREGLRDSLSKDGLLSPLVVWCNKGQVVLVDGHNRLEIIEELGGQDYAGEPIEILTKELFFGTRENAHNWVITNQLARRNLSRDVAALLRGKLYLSRKKSVGAPEQNANASVKQLPQSEAVVSTAAQIAKETGVSKATVERDASFASSAEKVGATAAIMAGTETRSRKDIIEQAKAATKKSNAKKQVEKPAKKIEPLVLQMFIGTCRVENPLSTWHVVNDANRDNQQTLVCTECWSHMDGGTMVGSPRDYWFYSCRCKKSRRDAALERKVDIRGQPDRNCPR